MGDGSVWMGVRSVWMGVRVGVGVDGCEGRGRCGWV